MTWSCDRYGGRARGRCTGTPSRVSVSMPPAASASKSTIGVGSGLRPLRTSAFRFWRSRRRPVLVVAAGAALGFFFAGAPLAVPASRLALTGARGRGGDSVAPVRSTTSSSYARSIANALLTCSLGGAAPFSSPQSEPLARTRS